MVICIGRCDIEQYNIVLVQLMLVYISAIYRYRLLSTKP